MIFRLSSVVTLPVVKSGGPSKLTSFQRMACVLSQQHAPKLPTGLGKEVNTAPTARRLATVRVQVPWSFVSKEQWVSFLGMINPPP